jgi:TatD DNase family protein
VIDTHCHLNFPQLRDDLDGVLARAAEAGVTHMVAIGTNVADSFANAELAATSSQIAATAGVHPCYDESARDVTDELRECLQKPGVLAVGECGLDYFHKDVPRHTQRHSFLRQLDLAAELDMPVVVHSRESVYDCLEIVKDYPTLTCVFHCFTGSLPQAQAVAEAGHYVGFTGPLTYKKNDALREVARQMPADQVLVETDAPYLSPEPLRGRRPCEPGYVAHTLAKLAEVWDWDVAEADRITTQNARKFYRWNLDAESQEVASSS